MTPEDNSVVRKTIRVTALAPIFVIGVGLIILGIVLFFQFSADEREFNAKMESIRAGKAAPETLTVINKYINAAYHGDQPHVVCRGIHSPRVNLPSTRAFYDSVALGSRVTAYYFANGYFVPESQGGQAGIAKWIFPGFDFTIGGLILGLGLFQSRRLSADVGHLVGLIKVRIDMAKRDQ